MEKQLYNEGEDVHYYSYMYNGTGITSFNATVTCVINKEKRMYEIMDKRTNRRLVIVENDTEEEEKRLGKNFGKTEYLDKNFL